MKFKNLKCIEIKQSEYDDIKMINTISSCQAVAVDNVIEYLIRDGKVAPELPRYIIKDMAYNLYMAVINNYKYLKVVD